MKRQGDTILDQPAAKKSDNVSTDLRSKIGAKLSTLLNRLSSANAARSKRQLYEDLFRESTHSEIIIDPTIVVKIEESDSDDCSENATKLPTENFLTSAKSRITELLQKRQDSGKENSQVSASGSAVASSVKSKTLQSISCNALNNRTKISNNESSDSSSSEIFISQKQLKNVCVLVEDIVKSGSINSIHSLLNEQTKNKISSIQNFSSENRKSILNTQKHKNAKDNNFTDKGIETSLKSYQNVDQHLELVNRPCSSQSHSYSSSNLTKSASKSSLKIDVPKSIISNCSDHPLTNNCELPNNILDLGDILIDRDNAKLQFYAEDSEHVDDPLVIDETVVSEENELESSCINSEFIQHEENPDTEVVLLCEKRPSYEVITLEEDDIEDVHKCSKCGKTFRAKSLLNFHLRMHGNNSDEASPVSQREMILSD